MSESGKFLIYCMERYRYAKNKSGSEVADIFEKYHVNDYIIKFFPSLHSMGEEYIIEDIDEFIASRQNPASHL